jgi:hypothetical protein
MNIAENMRQLAFKNKDVKEAYQKVLKDIKESAENGDLSVDAYNDETVLNLLIKDGFNIEGTHLKDTVKVRW